MLCPNCHAAIPDNSTSCPSCGQPVIHAREVMDAELLDRPGREQRGNFHQRVVFMQSHSSQILPSCQMGIITLALAFAMGLKFGLLACIGFLVFAGIARVITFAVNIQLMMMGRSINPLILQIVSWFCCWSLVAWLAS
ncbi:zinc ribbon domain-containing protein [Mailhella massiliensis]|uniref:Zinc ribbon domain-containing protein n=1 Tax=Mailhella massiliensis TaxID=1903261 RepID=A0A921AWW7_9BACT|nr:zinc ribbon domain-containing protein [Mailhella massiliensis]HJD97375.1 zinc ribbon domain-containing protein [Mailhella massiliensis]